MKQIILIAATILAIGIPAASAETYRTSTAGFGCERSYDFNTFANMIQTRDRDGMDMLIKTGKCAELPSVKAAVVHDTGSQTVEIRFMGTDRTLFTLRRYLSGCSK